MERLQPDPAGRPLDRWLSPLLDYIEDAIDGLIVDDEPRVERNLEAARDWVLARLDQ